MIEEVKDEETRKRFIQGRFSEADLWPSILAWLKGFYPFCEVSTASDFHDFTVDCGENKRTIVDYLISTNTENFPRSVRVRAHNLQMYIEHFNLQGGVLLVVSQSADEAFFVERTYTPKFKNDNPNVDLVVGYVESSTDGNVFMAVRSFGS